MTLAEQNGSGIIKTLAMPTCNRVDSAAASLPTYIKNSLRFGLECDYVLYDDSRSSQVRENYRALLRRLQEQFGVSVFYAGFEEKISFLKNLLSVTDVAPETVKFALFDIYKHGASTLGGNRNAALLDNPGRALITVDDDTFCAISKFADASEEVEFVPGDSYSVSDPCDLLTFSSRGEILDSVKPVDVPFLQIHGRLLGKRIGELGGGRTGNGIENPDCNRKVLLSFNGLAGDCAWAPLASHVYFFVTGHSLGRMTSSRVVYEAARSSREILRVTRQIAMSTVAAAPGAFFGMDNRELLPPFMPLGGAEDTFYWEMKRKCFPEDYFGHLPWALLHAPPTERQFHPADMTRSRQGFDFYSIVIAFLRSLSPQDSAKSVGARLSAIGREFEALGTLTVTEFELQVKEFLREDVIRIKTNLERKLSENTHGCDLWREDLQCFLRESWSLLDYPDMAVPVDFLCLGGREGALELARKLIGQYGELLKSWQSLTEGAAALRDAGIRLAQAIG
jgi:hypothetical protein